MANSRRGCGLQQGGVCPADRYRSQCLGLPAADAGDDDLLCSIPQRGAFLDPGYPTPAIRSEAPREGAGRAAPRVRGPSAVFLRLHLSRVVTRREGDNVGGADAQPRRAPMLRPMGCMRESRPAEDAAPRILHRTEHRLESGYRV